MGQGCIPPGGPDCLHADARVRLIPLDTLVVVRIQIAVKGFPGCGHIPPPDHHLGEVGPGNDIPAGQGLHLFQGDVHALLPQIADDAVFALIPPRPELSAQRLEPRCVRGQAVAQDMQAAVFLRPQLHAPQDLDSQLFPGPGRLIQAVQCVMICQREDGEAPLLGQPDQLCGRILPVRGSAMGVQVS